MTDTADHLIEAGLAAWMAGDLDALEAVLDPQVSLHGVQAGPWDCSGRDQVMRMLRQRQDQRGGRPQQTVRIARLDDHTYLVSTDNLCLDPAPEPVATRVTVTGNRVTRLQQFHPAPDHRPDDSAGKG